MDLNKMLQKYTKAKKSTIPSGLALNSGSNRGSSRFGEVNEGGNNKSRLDHVVFVLTLILTKISDSQS